MDGHGVVILEQNAWVYIVYIIVRRQSFVHIASHRGIRNMKTSVADVLLLLVAALAWLYRFGSRGHGSSYRTWLIQRPNYIVASLLVLAHAQQPSTLYAASLLSPGLQCKPGRSLLWKSIRGQENLAGLHGPASVSSTPSVYVYIGCRKRTRLVIPMTMGYTERL